MAVSPETIGDSDHAQGQMCRMRNACGSDMHAVFQAPGLLSVSQVHLALAAQTIIVHKGCRREGQGTAAQHDMGTGLGAHVRRDAADDMQGVRELLVE